MSAVSQPRLLQDPEILGELLHSLSQPLTTLCCSLELSIEKAAGQQQEAVSAALEQAERVISQVRLLREYLDAELIIPAGQVVAFTPVLRAVVEQLSSVAAVKQVTLLVVGASSATIAVAEPRLRLALQYLLGTMIDGLPANCEIMLRLEEGAAESLLRGEVESRSSVMDSPFGILEQHDEARISSRKVRLAIASRVLESSGASLTLGGAPAAFLLRIPRLSPRPV